MKLDYAAAADEIHHRLDKLGLSINPRNGGKIYLVGEPMLRTEITFNTRNNNFDYTINIRSKRVIFMCWLLFGGTLKIDFKNMIRRRD